MRKDNRYSILIEDDGRVCYAYLLFVDSKIESADGWSPYSAMLDNPVFNIEPLGDSSIPWITILWGGAKAVGGLAEMAIGAAAGGMSSWTGIGALAGTAAVAHGADVTTTGLTQLWTGQEASTATEQGISSSLLAAGVSQEK